MGRYSKAPRSAAVTAVTTVFWALITMIGSSGRLLRIWGSTSKTLASGIITSVTIRSPSPSAAHFTRVEAAPVALT